MEKSNETFDEAQLQRLSDVANDTVEAEIKVNPLSSNVPRLSSLFNLNKLNLLPMRNMMESLEDDLNNEIMKSDVIEIEVPLIGLDYVKVRKEHWSQNKNTLEANEDVDTDNSAAEVDVDTTQLASDLSATDNILTFSVDFQTSPNDETTNQNIVETTTPAAAQVGDADTTTTSDDEARNESTNESQTDRIQSVESKLIEHWRTADSPMTDGSIESKLFTIKSRHHPKYPFNVKIVVNNDDERKSCKSKTSCRQVRASRLRNRDIDPEFYVDYSDEDLYFKNEPLRYYDRPNVLRSRNAKRAADDLNPITPAPRSQPFQPLRGLKKPGFIERLENESSLERSERINKNLDGLMRVVGVWAHVDRFVSERARSAIQKLAYLTGDDLGDFNVGSKKGSDRKRFVDDDPFT